MHCLFLSNFMLSKYLVIILSIIFSSNKSFFLFSNNVVKILLFSNICKTYVKYLLNIFSLINCIEQDAISSVNLFTFPLNICSIISLQSSSFSLFSSIKLYTFSKILFFMSDSFIKDISLIYSFTNSSFSLNSFFINVINVLLNSSSK